MRVGRAAHAGGGARARSAAWASDAWRWAGVLAFFFLGRGSCAAAAVNASAADRLARTTARAAASLDACSFVGSGGRAWSGVTVTRAGFCADDVETLLDFEPRPRDALAAASSSLPG